MWYPDQQQHPLVRELVSTHVLRLPEPATLGTLPEVFFFFLQGSNSVFIPIPKKGNAKECSNYRTIALILHASKVMLKVLQARLQQYMKRELPDVQAG